MRAWIELLPLFVVRLLSRRMCERLPLAGRVVVNPRPGTFFDAPKP